jgi:hypothetical protein
MTQIRIPFMKHFRYARYLFLHKLYVWQAGVLLGVPRWRLLVHDWQKFLPAEWGPYAEKFFGPQDDIGKHYQEVAKRRTLRDYYFTYAWNHHLKFGPHHWQYWVLPKQITVGHVKVECLEIPSKYVREMVADWSGARKAITGEADPRIWFADQIEHGNIIMSASSQEEAMDLMEEVWG